MISHACKRITEENELG